VTAAQQPEISVVVAVGRLRERAGRCLASLAAQGLGERMEVLLVDCAPASAAVPGAEASWVRTLQEAPGITFAHARAVAVAQARAPVVAFVEEHVRVRAGWAQALLDTYATGDWAGVGAVPFQGSAHPQAELLHLASYGDWSPPVPQGDVEWLPGHNASFRTAVLRALGEDLERLLGCDLLLHQRLRRDGRRLVMAPGAEIDHLNEASVRELCRGLFLWYRCYAPLRATEERWSAARRAAYVLGAPLVPLWALRTWRRRLRRGGGPWLLRLLRWLPSIIALHGAGAWGQALGLAFGPGDAPVRFSDYELHALRPEPGHS